MLDGSLRKSRRQVIKAQAKGQIAIPRELREVLGLDRRRF